MNTKILFTVYLILLGVALQAQELTKCKADNGKWGLKNENGTIVIEPKYDDIASFSEGLVAVNIGKQGLFGSGGKWGFVNKKGKTAITTQFEGMFAPVFKNGKAKVKKDGREFYIDKKGKEVK